VRQAGNWRIGVTLLAICFASAGAQGAVSLSGTRLVFDGRYREASLQASNRGANDVLLQALLSAPEDDDDTPAAQRRSLPFVVTPHLHRLTAGGKQTLRILYQGTGMPADRESLLHLYVTQVPKQSEGSNQLNIAVRQRINVFYRPPGIAGDPAATAEALRWTIERSASGDRTLRVDNPTAYHAALQTLSLDGIALSDYQLLAPGARHHFALPVLTPAQRRYLAFKALTDYGGQRDYCATFTDDAAFSARLRENLQPQEHC
jgi:P pilus assembly chaperone PapD